MSPEDFMDLLTGHGKHRGGPPWILLFPPLLFLIALMIYTSPAWLK